MPDVPIAFFSYSREDSEFALRLANDLRAAGADVWIDQLDIEPGQRWDRSVQQALETCPTFLLILSPASVKSDNVLDEVSFALDKQKTLIPILHRDCEIPFRIRRFQHLDFRSDYDRMLMELQKCLHTGTAAAPLSSEQIEDPVHAPADDFRAPLRQEPSVSAVPRVAATASSGGGWPRSRWIMMGVAAIVVIFAIFLLSRWVSSEKLSRQQEAAALRSSSTAMAVPVEAEIHTGLAHGQSNPPCAVPASSESDFSTTDPSVWFFFGFKHADPSDQWKVNWIEPNGSVYKTNSVPRSTAAGRYCFEMKIAGTPVQRMPGEWAVCLNRSGSDVGERKFAIRTGRP